ncbi:unnamed protein product [Lactuca virosa]|uniref:Uncharacterized protein n=1 Tax=Lactuca virosa TaxID=75947 RepID=A0AAU9MUS7_9ASTR|nr:unnamed protein product [Lactuca virosa]
MFGLDMIPHLSRTGPALDLFKAKLEAVMDEARSQQAASMTEFHWLGHRFPISNAKTRVSILKAKELEKEINYRKEGALPSEKRLAVFDKIFAAYHEAGSSIRNDFDDLSGLDKVTLNATNCWLVLQRNTADLSDLLSSGRDRK